jgi:hypothetical protein
LRSTRARANASRLQGCQSIREAGVFGTLNSLNYNEVMFALRCAGLIALTIWVGGLIGVGAVAAPAIFETIDARQGPDGRLLAGAVAGEMFRRFHWVGYACGAALVGVLTLRAVLGPRPRWFAARAALAVAMLGSSAYSGFVVSPRIENTRKEIGVSPSSLPEGDARRAAFGRLHAQSSLLQLVPIVGGLVLIVLELRD